MSRGEASHGTTTTNISPKNSDERPDALGGPHGPRDTPSDSTADERRPPDDVRSLEAQGARAMVDALPRALDELQRRCRLLETAIDAGDPVRVEAQARLVLSGWQTARTSLAPAPTGCAHGASAQIALRAAGNAINLMFDRAHAALTGGSGAHARARVALDLLRAAMAQASKDAR